MRISLEEYQNYVSEISKLECFTIVKSIQVGDNHFHMSTFFYEDKNLLTKMEYFEDTEEMNIYFYDVKNKLSPSRLRTEFKSFFEDLGDRFPPELLFYIDLFSKF